MAAEMMVSWDWREQPPWDEISDAQQRGFLHVRLVPDTGSDAYVLVLSDAPVSEAEAQAVFNEAVERE